MHAVLISDAAILFLLPVLDLDCITMHVQDDAYKHQVDDLLTVAPHHRFRMPHAPQNTLGFLGVSCTSHNQQKQGAEGSA